MFLHCCCQSKTDVEVLREKMEDMKKQINNIYELLEVLTNESKCKTKYLDEFNSKDVPKENDVKTKHTYFIDKTAV